MVNSDLTRIINSDEVQSVVRPVKKDVKRATLKKNPLKNLNVMLRLNPYAKTAKRMALLAEAERVKAKKEKLDKKRKTVSKVIYFYIDKIFCLNFVFFVFIVFD
jgi:large subunit ribosomal protein L4e